MLVIHCHFTGWINYQANLLSTIFYIVRPDFNFRIAFHLSDSLGEALNQITQQPFEQLLSCDHYSTKKDVGKCKVKPHLELRSFRVKSISMVENELSHFMCFSLLNKIFHSLSNSSVFFFYRMAVDQTVSYFTPSSTTGLTWKAS